MLSPVPSSSRLTFGEFVLDRDAGELRRHGERVTIAEQPLRLLEFLLAHPGVLVTREQLQTELWTGDTFVDFEHGLNAAVKRLRDALGDSAEAPRFIETVPKRGYRFIAPVQRDKASEPPGYRLCLGSAPEHAGKRRGRDVALQSGPPPGCCCC